MREPGQVKAMREAREAAQAKQEKKMARRRDTLIGVGSALGAGLGLLSGTGDVGIFGGAALGGHLGNKAHENLSSGQKWYGK